MLLRRTTGILLDLDTYMNIPSPIIYAALHFLLQAVDSDHDPVQGAEKKALDRVPIFVGAKSAAFFSAIDAEENKDS